MDETKAAGKAFDTQEKNFKAAETRSNETQRRVKMIIAGEEERLN